MLSLSNETWNLLLFLFTAYHWICTGWWNLSTLNIWICLSCIINTMVADDLDIETSRLSATLEYSSFSYAWMNTLWPRHNGHHFANNFCRFFLSQNTHNFIKFNRSLFLCSKWISASANSSNGLAAHWLPENNWNNNATMHHRAEIKTYLRFLSSFIKRMAQIIEGLLYGRSWGLSQKERRSYQVWRFPY